MLLTWTYSTLDPLPEVPVIRSTPNYDDLQPGECGGLSCPQEWEDRLVETLGPGGGGGTKKHFYRDTGGGHRVLRSHKSLS